MWLHWAFHLGNGLNSPPPLPTFLPQATQSLAVWPESCFHWYSKRSYPKGHYEAFRKRKEQLQRLLGITANDRSQSQLKRSCHLRSRPIVSGLFSFPTWSGSRPTRSLPAANVSKQGLCRPSPFQLIERCHLYSWYLSSCLRLTSTVILSQQIERFLALPTSVTSWWYWHWISHILSQPCVQPLV